MSFPLNQYIIVIQVSHDRIKYSYCITHIFNKFTNLINLHMAVCDAWNLKSNKGNLRRVEILQYSETCIMIMDITSTRDLT